MAPQKRRSPRYPAAIRARWIVGNQAIETTVVSISEHGLFLLTDRDIEPGMLMQLTVELSDGVHRMIVVSRFVGQTAEGHGIGAEIFVAAPTLRKSWSTLNGSLARGFRPVAAVG